MTIWSRLDLVIGVFCLLFALPTRGIVRYTFIVAGLVACADAFIYEDETPWLSWAMDIVFFGSLAIGFFRGRNRAPDQSPA